GQTMGLTSIVVSHDLDETFRLADHVIVLGPGAVAAQGTPEEVRASTDPLVHQFVRALPSGPVPFHYPATGVAEDFGGVPGAGGAPRMSATPCAASWRTSAPARGCSRGCSRWLVPPRRVRRWCATRCTSWATIRCPSSPPRACSWGSCWRCRATTCYSCTARP